jgi:hypothetical protein
MAVFSPTPLVADSFLDLAIISWYSKIKQRNPMLRQIVGHIESGHRFLRYE